MVVRSLWVWGRQILGVAFSQPLLWMGQAGWWDPMLISPHSIHCTRTGSSFPLESGLIFFSMLANSLNNPFQIFLLGYILLVEKDLTQYPLWVMNNACTAWFHYYPRVYCSHHTTEGIALFLHKCCLVLGIRVWGKPFVFVCSFVSLKCSIVSFSL